VVGVHELAKELLLNKLHCCKDSHRQHCHAGKAVCS
jgi:hypothetical protein